MCIGFRTRPGLCNIDDGKSNGIVISVDRNVVPCTFRCELASCTKCVCLGVWMGFKYCYRCCRILFIFFRTNSRSSFSLRLYRCVFGYKSVIASSIDFRAPTVHHFWSPIPRGCVLAVVELNTQPPPSSLAWVDIQNQRFRSCELCGAQNASHQTNSINHWVSGVWRIRQIDAKCDDDIRKAIKYESFERELRQMRAMFTAYLWLVWVIDGSLCSRLRVFTRYLCTNDYIESMLYLRQRQRSMHSLFTAINFPASTIPSNFTLFLSPPLSLPCRLLYLR